MDNLERRFYPEHKFLRVKDVVKELVEYAAAYGLDLDPTVIAQRLTTKQCQRFADAYFACNVQPSVDHPVAVETEDIIRAMGYQLHQYA